MEHSVSMSECEAARTAPVSSTRKRKADSLGRLTASGDDRCRSGRGRQSGWTSCPLCGRHSTKRFALGRGIATHLHAVHTPWYPPSKIEIKKRRRLMECQLLESRQRTQQPKVHPECNKNDVDSVVGCRTNVVLTEYVPTQQEVDDWDAQVLQILKEIEDHACKEKGDNSIPPGFDRNGNESCAYRQSLPPFLQAAADGDLKLLQSLIQQRQKEDLVQAAGDGLSKGDKTSCSRGRVWDLIHTRDRHLSTAEHWAAGGGHLTCLQYLLQMRRDYMSSEADTLLAEDGTSTFLPKSRRRRDGKTCLHYASRNGHLDCVQYLLQEEGASVDETSSDGTTPLHMACFGGHVPVVSYLISQGANVFATNDWGCGSAHWVGMTKCQSEANIRSLCQMLRKNGVCFITPQKQGHTALHKAAQKLNRFVIEYMAQTADEGGAGLNCEQMKQAGLPDQGGHLASDIWCSSGGDEAFGNRMKHEWTW